MSRFNMTAIVWDELDTTELKEPETYHNFTEDPLLISCTLYRIIKEAPEEKKFLYRNWSLTSHMDKIVAKVTDQDRIYAETVRSYYRSKLIVAKLRNENFTKFRTDLCKFLEEAPSKITTDFIGMVYKLPYFYAYDMRLYEIFGGEYATVDGSLHRKDEATLEFLGKTDNGRKRYLNYEYWFRDPNDNYVLVEVAKINPILKLWEHTIKSNKITVSAKFTTKRKDNLEYYIATGWEINV